MKIFLGIQIGFLLLSVLTGGFQFKLWSMLDSALLIQSIGVTALVFVLEEGKPRGLAWAHPHLVALLLLFCEAWLKRLLSQSVQDRWLLRVGRDGRVF